MNSPAWWATRRAWLVTWREHHNDQNPRCVVCDGPWTDHHGDLHHRTYARLGREIFEDLIPICRGCHTQLHAIIDASPGWRRADRAVSTDLILQEMRTHRVL